MKTYITKNLKRIGIIAGVVVALLIILLWVLSWSGSRPTVAEQVKHQVYLAGLIDPSQQDLVKVNVSGDVSRTIVGSMPQVVLGMPKGDWFSDQSLLSLAKTLGFTSKSNVQSFSNQLYWLEGPRTLSIDTRTGIISFSTSFNIDAPPVSSATPSEQNAKAALLTFFAEIEIPTENYNIDGATYSYMTIDNTGLIDSSFQQAGGLVKIVIPYTILGYEAVLPVETMAIFDAEGMIVNLSLLLVSVVPTGESVSLVSESYAKSQLTYGGVVLSGSSPALDSISAQAIYPAYYLSQSDFYDVSSRRELEPLYIFSENTVKVGVPARKL